MWRSISRTSFFSPMASCHCDLLRRASDAGRFPPEYVIEHDAEGRAITKTAQVAKCGNSVCPPLAEALVRANMPTRNTAQEAQAA